LKVQALPCCAYQVLTPIAHDAAAPKQDAIDAAVADVTASPAYVYLSGVVDPLEAVTPPRMSSTLLPAVDPRIVIADAAVVEATASAESVYLLRMVHLLPI
jgi:hypothetical protein